jgi:hypothetical protein
MNKTKSILFFAFLASFAVMLGCRGNSSDPNAGFSVATYVAVRPIVQFGNQVGPDMVMPQSAIVSGQWLNDNSGATGSVYNFGPVNTGTQANTPFNKYTATSARAPARWRLRAGIAGCPGPVGRDADVIRGTTTDLSCVVARLVIIFGANPNDIDAQNPPNAITISGSGLDASYGMPVVTAYDEFGNFAGQETATWVAADGSSLIVNTPSGLTVRNGAYNLSVENIMSDGSQNLLGMGHINVYNVPDDPPPDNSGCWGYEGIKPGC